jgi:phosphorylcholine metabolism protein LicD
LKAKQIVTQITSVLRQGDTKGLKEIIEKIGSQVLLDEAVLEEARLQERPEVVTFLATLKINNPSGDISTHKMLLEAYQRLLSGNSNNCENKLIKINGPLWLAIQACSESKQDEGVSKSLPIAASRWQEWRLALEICLEFSRFKEATYLLESFNLKFSKKNIFLNILNSCKTRLERIKPYPLSDRLNKSLFAEALHEKSKIYKNDWINSATALLAAQAHQEAENYEEAVRWSRIVKEEKLINQGLMQTAISECHAGRLRNSAMYLDKLLSKLADEIFTQCPTEIKQIEQGNEFPTNAAFIALEDLQRTLSSINQKPFLFSGTLLGFAREKGLLKHDKDIDVGIIGWENQFSILEQLANSGLFKIPVKYFAGEKTYVIPLVHAQSGIAIDVFLFHKIKNKFVTAITHTFGYTEFFEYTPFEPVPVKFNGIEFYVPSDVDKNLTENFGNWKIPDKEYLSHLEAPSIVDMGGPVWMIAARCILVNAIYKKKFNILERVTSLLKEKSKGELPLNDNLMNKIKIISDRKNIKVTRQINCINSYEYNYT